MYTYLYKDIVSKTYIHVYVNRSHPQRPDADSRQASMHPADDDTPGAYGVARTVCLAEQDVRYRVYGLRLRL